MTAGDTSRVYQKGVPEGGTRMVYQPGEGMTLDSLGRNETEHQA